MTWQSVYPIVLPFGGLALMFIVGLCSSVRLGLIPAGVGFTVNLATQWAEGGPGLCVGSVAFPLVFTAAAFAGRGLREVLVGYGWILTPQIPPRVPVCVHCGYCVIGLPTRVCPECGQMFDDRANDDPADEA